MPNDADIQDALKQSIITRPTWQPWLMKRGLTHLDIDIQWEDFVQACLARDYRYSDWYAAFQKWLTSPYQATRDGTATRSRDYTMDDINRLLDEAEREGRL
jgi:hypothetical protein